MIDALLRWGRRVKRASPCGALNVRYISLFVWEGGNTDGRVSPDLANASDQTAHAGAMSPDLAGELMPACESRPRWRAPVSPVLDRVSRDLGYAPGGRAHAGACLADERACLPISAADRVAMGEGEGGRG